MQCTEKAYWKYKDLIWYAAQVYGQSPCVDREELFQDACVKMVEFFGTRGAADDEHAHNTFKKSLFFWVHKSARKQIRQQKPIPGHRMVRLEYRDQDPQQRHDVSEAGVNMDEVLACEDVCVLTKMYAEEFVAELRRLLTEWDRVIFDMMVRSVDTGETRIDIVNHVVDLSGYTDSFVYNRMKNIRRLAGRVLSKSA